MHAAGPRPGAPSMGGTRVEHHSPPTRAVGSGQTHCRDLRKQTPLRFFTGAWAGVFLDVRACLQVAGPVRGGCGGRVRWLSVG